MGDDTPLAVLSLQPRLLYTYFKQLFAQVTNPPIDPLREKLVMSLNTIMGWRRNLLGETPEHARLISAESPILMRARTRRAVCDDRWRVINLATVIRALAAVGEGAEGLEAAISAHLRGGGERGGCRAAHCVLSDRGVDHANVPVPMLLAVGAVHHHLIRVGKRMKASLVCETGEARDVHHMACLIGYGASAIVPYLALRDLPGDPREDAVRGASNVRAGGEELPQGAGIGLLKIMSKMGISVLASYRGAQIFEAIGLGLDR